MVEITFQEAKNFLEKITRDDDVAIIHHDDGDGFSSGILYYDWCKNKNADVKQFAYSIRTSDLKKFDLKKFNKIIISDLAPSFVADGLKTIKDKEILYADHHPRNRPIPKEVLELVTVNQGYIPSSRTAGELTGIKLWLSLSGTINDSGEIYPENQKFINERLGELNMTIDEFRRDVANTITNFLIYFNKDYDKAFEILEKIDSVEDISQLKKYSVSVEKEIKRIVKQYDNEKEKIGRINFYYFKPLLPVTAPVCGIISQRNENQAYIFATPKSDGKYITFSARSSPKKMNVCNLLKAGIDGLEGSAAGGHNSASGGIILAKDIKKFKNNIKNFLESN